MFKHALIDIFVADDSQWHNVKITEFIKEDQTIQYQGIFDKEIKGAIDYRRNWWKIAKYKSKDIEKSSTNTVNTLIALRYRTQNVYKQNLMISGYLQAKQRCFEIKSKCQYMFCYNNQSKS